MMNERSLYVLLCICLIVGAFASPEDTKSRVKDEKPTPASDGRIKHVVVLMMENRPFDHMLGWSSEELGTEGLTGEEFNLVDPSDPNSEKVYVSDKAPFLNECDPSHTVPSTTAKLFSSQSAKDSGVPDMAGFVAAQNGSTEGSGGQALDWCNVMDGFPPSRVPVLTALAKNYAVMDHFYASVPGPTWPNRMFALSGTSAGDEDTNMWYHDIVGKLYPQRTIFDQVDQAGQQWKLYYNDTPWELILEKVAHSPDNLHPLSVFFEDCEEGTLPAFSWINPSSGIDITTGVGCNDQHPDHDISAGEQYYKDIYEAIRASPSWEDTLFIITYDEHGGFYDHVIPPSVNIPPPGDGENPPSKSGDPAFQFDRLGVRIPTILISPWIKAGTVIGEPGPEATKPAENSEYELTSIISTARKLLGIPNDPLTDRDAWSATFENVLLQLEIPRTSDDCPMHMPDALVPEKPSNTDNTNTNSNSNSNSKTNTTVPEQDREINDLQKVITNIHGALSGHDFSNYYPRTQGDHSKFVLHHYQRHAASTRAWQASKRLPMAKVVIKARQDFTRVTDTDREQLSQSQPQSQSQQFESSGWDLNGLSFGSLSPQYSNSTSPYITVSSRVQRQDGKVFCMDAGEGIPGSEVKMSLCYPTQDPDTNRDPKQHFVMSPDATLRFYNANANSTTASPPLCVTNHMFDQYSDNNSEQDSDKDEDEDKDSNIKDDTNTGSGTGTQDMPRNLTLEVCDRSIGQSLAYHGNSPGDMAAPEGGDGSLEFGDAEFYVGAVIL